MNTHASNPDNIIIPGLAEVESHEADAFLSTDIQADAKDIHVFCLRQGNLQLNASFIPHPVELTGSEAIFLAYPKGDWSIHVSAEPGCRYYMMRMETGALHSLINPDFDHGKLENKTRSDFRNLMRVLPVSPSLMISFDQLMHPRISKPFKQILEKAKFLEIFSMLMEAAFGQRMETCPVAISPNIEKKLHLVRRHITDHLDEAPDPDSLAVMYELPKSTLREGYKYVFGKTIHQYHSDHKLEAALQMLNDGEMLVKEIAFRIGYQNPSHFISAFKKKFGYTPKEYRISNIEYRSSRSQV